jgi:hypothetical protein
MRQGPRWLLAPARAGDRLEAGGEPLGEPSPNQLTQCPYIVGAGTDRPAGRWAAKHGRRLPEPERRHRGGNRRRGP